MMLPIIEPYKTGPRNEKPTLRMKKVLMCIERPEKAILNSN